MTCYGWHDLPQGLWIFNEYFNVIWYNILRLGTLSPSTFIHINMVAWNNKVTQISEKNLYIRNTLDIFSKFIDLLNFAVDRRDMQTARQTSSSEIHRLISYWLLKNRKIPKKVHWLQYIIFGIIRLFSSIFKCFNAFLMNSYIYFLVSDVQKILSDEHKSFTINDIVVVAMVTMTLKNNSDLDFLFP